MKRFFYLLVLMLQFTQQRVDAKDVLIRVLLETKPSDTASQGAFSIKTLRFYLSEITYLHDGISVWVEPEGYRLIDASDSSTFNLATFMPDTIVFDAIRFRLGVDSVSSSTGAHTGALDPVNGMYWAWHTGYVNLKIEGNCLACPPPRNEFEFHIGGFQTPYDAERLITLPAPDSTYFEIVFDITKIVEEALSNQQFRIMTPGVAAMRLADVAAGSFSIR